MISKMHQKLGTAGLVVAILALIVALGGVAIAAVPGLNSKQKKQVTKIAKKYAGAPGAAGSAGSQGPKGEPGAAGKDGTNGVSPVGSEFTGEEGPCSEGGVKFSGSSTTFACNGRPGPTDTKLPSGETLKGLWQFQVNNNPFGLGLMTISFPLRVEPGPDPVWVPAGTSEGENEHCPGEVDNPKADPGYFCVYAGLVLGTATEEPSSLGADAALGYRGEWAIEGEVALAYGSWAVTAD
ncbi:MAG: hypothetical protein ACTHNY_02485 [Solirubrobacterales bacterium]